MKRITLMAAVLGLGLSSALAQFESVVFYSGKESSPEMYLWTWGFAVNPDTIENVGYTPGTAAVEVKWDTTGAWTDPSWISYGAFFGFSSNEGVVIDDFVPDSLFFKLRAPDGLQESDTLVIWIYDRNNWTWDNTLFYEFSALKTLEDKQWHQFSICLWDFETYLYEIDYADIVAVSFERPPGIGNRLYIDDVWIGNPKLPVNMTIFDGKKVSPGIVFDAWGFENNDLTIAEGEGSAPGTNAIVWETATATDWQGQRFSFVPQDLTYSWPADSLKIKIKAPAGINDLSLGLYDKDGYAVWYPVNAEAFGFDGSWKQLTIPLNEMALYWDKFDTTSVTEFRLENGYENQVIPERILYDDIGIGDVTFMTTAVNRRPSSIFTSFELSENHPNPFNPSTTIDYSIPRPSDVKLTVYNSLGQVVAILIDDRQTQGRYAVQFRPDALSSGVYFYSLETNGTIVSIKKMLFMK